MKQLNAMGNRRHYYRNSAASRMQQANDQNQQAQSQQQQQQQQQQPPQIATMNFKLESSIPSLNRPAQAQINNPNVLAHSNGQLNLTSSMLPQQQNGPRGPFDLVNENNDLINGSVNMNMGPINNSIGMAPNNYMHTGKLPYNMYLF